MLILYKKKKIVSISPTLLWKVISAYLLSVEYAKYLPLGEYTEHLTGSVGLASQSVNNKGGFKKRYVRFIQRQAIQGSVFWSCF